MDKLIGDWCLVVVIILQVHLFIFTQLSNNNIIQVHLFIGQVGGIPGPHVSETRQTETTNNTNARKPEGNRDNNAATSVYIREEKRRVFWPRRGGGFVASRRQVEEDQEEGFLAFRGCPRAPFWYVKPSPSCSCSFFVSLAPRSRRLRLPLLPSCCAGLISSGTDDLGCSVGSGCLSLFLLERRPDACISYDTCCVLLLDKHHSVSCLVILGLWLILA